MKKAESCRRWRESLGAYALDRLDTGNAPASRPISKAVPRAGPSLLR
jgi:hypothetical protein